MRIAINVPDGMHPALALGVVAGALMNGRTTYSLTPDATLFSIEDEAPSMDLRLEIIAALSGESNDAEHDALVAVAQEFGIEYTSAYEVDESDDPE